MEKINKKRSDITNPVNSKEENCFCKLLEDSEEEFVEDNEDVEDDKECGNTGIDSNINLIRQNIGNKFNLVTKNVFNKLKEKLKNNKSYTYIYDRWDSKIKEKQTTTVPIYITTKKIVYGIDEIKDGIGYIIRDISLYDTTITNKDIRIKDIPYINVEFTDEKNVIIFDEKTTNNEVDRYMEIIVNKIIEKLKNNINYEINV
jgi:hypothetical protein